MYTHLHRSLLRLEIVSFLPWEKRKGMLWNPCKNVGTQKCGDEEQRIKMTNCQSPRSGSMLVPESSLISVAGFYKRTQIQETSSSLQEVFVFSPKWPVLTGGQQLVRSHSHHDLYVHFKEPLSDLRTNWSLNHKGSYFTKRRMQKNVSGRAQGRVWTYFCYGRENKVQRSHPILSTNSKGENSMLSWKATGYSSSEDWL